MTPIHRRLIIPILIGLALLAYAPSFGLPLLEDDYPLLTQAMRYGSDFGALWADPLMRVRATSNWLMLGMYKCVGIAPLAYHAVSAALHAANTVLLYLVLAAVAPEAALWAAAFFAVAEGHQEAVMWFSACNELLQFFFGGLAFWMWSRGWRWWSAVPFGLALLSKESAVVLLPLLVLTFGWRRWKPLAPWGLLALWAAWGVYVTRAYSFRFNDGSFSLGAPFYLTLPWNLVRVLWPWGAAALAYTRRWRTLGWMALAMLPYSFLTYSRQIPSRQTYLASVGVALLFGWAAARLPRRWLVPVLALALVHNVGYLWVRKLAQFEERAAPTEALIAAARQAPGAVIFVECFPRNRLIAEEAVRLGAGKRVVWESSPGAARFCYKEKQ